MDIYKEEVMDHYEHPRNQGSFDDAQDREIVEGKDANATCGDMIQFQLRVEKGKIIEVKWTGIGCAITTASASKLSEWLVGKKVEDLQRMTEEEMLKGGVGFQVNPGRSKCVRLSVKVVKEMLNSE